MGWGAHHDRPEQDLDVLRAELTACRAEIARLRALVERAAEMFEGEGYSTVGADLRSELAAGS